MSEPNELASPEFHLDLALRAFQEARDNVDGERQPKTFGVVLHDIADVHSLAGRTADAVEVFRESAVYKRRGGNLADLQTTLIALTRSLLDDGLPAEAEEVLDESGELLTRPGIALDPARRAGRLHEVGRLYERIARTGSTGAHVKALDMYVAALDLNERSVDPRTRTALLHDIGNMQRALGRFTDASESYTLAADLARAEQATDDLVSVLIALGRVQMDLASAADRVRPVTPPSAPDPDAADPDAAEPDPADPDATDPGPASAEDAA